MIIFARIIEAWRDARIFEFQTEPRGKLWHFLKYPQFGFRVGSALAYFLILNFGLEIFVQWVWNLQAAIVVIGIDAGLAYFVFEWFLPFFRKRMKHTSPGLEKFFRHAEKQLRIHLTESGID